MITKEQLVSLISGSTRKTFLYEEITWSHEPPRPITVEVNSDGTLRLVTVHDCPNEDGDVVERHVLHYEYTCPSWYVLRDRESPEVIEFFVVYFKELDIFIQLSGTYDQEIGTNFSNVSQVKPFDANGERRWAWV
jgi:hypothetical protein